MHGGRHEHGQNFLSDAATIRRVIDLVARTRGPIIEIGPGRGALTRELQRLGRPLTAVEIDARLTRHLDQHVGRGVRIVTADFLRWPLPTTTPYVIVGNLPFHLTTAMLRRVLHAPGWTNAVLLVQWEVARRRAGVGGVTMMTAQWWPWMTFDLHGRVPARAFAPRPSVDGGLLAVERRPAPLVAAGRGDEYRAFVHAIFQGRGRGLPDIARRVTAPDRRDALETWLARERVAAASLPRDLDAAQWAGLFHAARGESAPRATGSGRPRRARSRSRPGPRAGR